MGKDSLIKSTTGKSAGKKQKPAGKKAKSPKTTNAKAPKKAAAGAKTVKKSASPKTTQKASTAVSMKDLRFKRFEWKTGPVAPPPPPPDMSRMTAPPFIAADDPSEAQRLRALLFQPFSMADVQAAAKPPVTPDPAPEPTPEPAAAPTPDPASEPVPEPTPPAPPAVASGPAPEAQVEEPPAVAEQPIETESAAAETPVKTEPAAVVPPFQTAQPQVGIRPQAEALTAPQPASPSSDLPPGAPPPPPDPVMRYFKIGAAVLGIIAVLLLWSSFSNSGKYYVAVQKEGLTVWQGAFSPMGKRVLATLPGQHMEDPVQPVYTRKEIFPLLFTYYLNRADAMLGASGLLDLAAIQAKLEHAQRYALDQDMRAAVRMRSNTLERTQLIHKAHVEISKGAPASMEAALGHLKKALRMADDVVQRDAIAQIIALVEQQKARMPAR